MPEFSKTDVAVFCTAVRSEEGIAELLCNENSFDTKQIFAIDFFISCALPSSFYFAGCVRFVLRVGLLFCAVPVLCV